jgi:adenine-specific DNA-methyltransferase
MIMDKMRFESTDIIDKNIKKISQLFPGIVIEGKVNFDLLRSLLGDEVHGDEAYEFTWVGKGAAIAEAGRPIRKTLLPCKEESKNWDTTENLYIEGDNLDVLKLLQESYLGKVKMIYIDPPYNTGNDFVYRDNFMQDKDEYDEEAGVYDEDGDRLFRNTESNGRFHSDWCSMMYPRLVLARNLLREDGVIFISIDDNEVAQLRKICDEVFGESNFVSQLIWQRAFSPKNDAKFVSCSHDYVLIYAKAIGSFAIGRLERTEKANARYSNPDSDPRGVWMSSDISVKTYTAENDYPITTPSGRVIEPPAGRCWSLSKKAFFDRLHDNRIWFGPDGNNTPRIKRFLTDLRKEGMTPTSILFHKEVGHSQEGAQEVVSIFNGQGLFDGPKPVRLLLRLLTLANTGEDSIILDFFSGSASTAHAIMRYNADKGGKRKFIMVQVPEECPPGTKAAKAGYANICEIGKERIRRAGEKIKAEAGMLGQDLDIGFRVLKLDSTNMRDVFYSAGEYSQDMLSALEDNIKEDRSDMDLLYACLLDWGLPLSFPHTREQISGFTVHTYNDGDLIACFD